MAREVVEKLTDDLDGSTAAETVTFGLDGTTYQIDLSKKNAAALRKALDPYVKAGRRPVTKTARRARTSGNGKRPERDFDIIQLREWAGANGVTVPTRGRIPTAIVEQYKASGGH